MSSSLISDTGSGDSQPNTQPSRDDRAKRSESQSDEISVELPDFIENPIEDILKDKLGNVSQDIINIKGYPYKLKSIPDIFHLTIDVIDDETENKLIQLIEEHIVKGKKMNESIELNKILKCFMAEFNTNLPQNLKLNKFTVNKIKAGEGMDFYVENPKQFKPVSVVLSLGSDVLMSFRDIKTNFKTDVVIPKQSLMLLIDSPTSGSVPNKVANNFFNYQRGIAKRTFDSIQNGQTINRKDRYSILFQSAKE